jgi:transposase InsO family protein
MRYQFIDDYRDDWPVRVMCRVLRVSPSGFYAWRSRPVSDQAIRHGELVQKVQQIFQDNRRVYGSPRVHEQLLANGDYCSVSTVAKIMRKQGLKAKGTKRFNPTTTDSKHDQPIADNLLQRDFSATGPNQKWVADITYIPTRMGWLYLAVVLDVFSRRVVGWSVADHLRADLVCQAFRMAIRKRKPDAGLIHHSDRGVQYASGVYQDLLGLYGITCSMSRKGNCYDNAMMESFMGTLKVELVHGSDWGDHDQASQAVFEYIEVFYNRVRLHSSLGYKSPLDYEQQTA